MAEFNYAIWSIWAQLGLLYKVFCLLLFLVSAYTLFTTARVWVRLRSLMPQRDGETIPSSRRSLRDLEDRLRNVRQFIAATLCLFGLLFFIQLPHDLWTNETGRESVGMAIWGVLSINFAFGASVFFVILILHLAQWLASARVLTAQRHLDV